MFGSKQEKIEKMVKKNDWTKLNKECSRADAKTCVMIAKACAASNEDGSFNLLSILIRDADEQVQREAIRSLGETGNDHATAELQWIMTKIPEGNKETLKVAHDALEQVRQRK